MARVSVSSGLRFLFIILAVALLSFLPNKSAAGTEFVIDTNNRVSVIQAYQQILKPALGTPTDWSGSALGCLAGNTSDLQKKSTMAAINFMRSMVQLKPVKENSRLSLLARESALIGEANQAISHNPSNRKLCFSNAGYKGSKNGNLSLSPIYEGEVKNLAQATGARGVVEFITDQGENNKVVGHRRWLLYSRLTEVGLGDTDHASTIVVVGGKLAKPVKKWIAWPSAGYFPRELEPNGRWSLSYPGADFKRASISVIGPSGLIRTKKHPSKTGFADNTISWEMTLPSIFKKSTDDFDVSVQVKNILINGKKVTRSYKVSLIQGSATVEKSNSSPSNEIPEESPEAVVNDKIKVGEGSTEQGDGLKPIQMREFTEDQLRNFKRPDVKFLGLTACKKIGNEWKMTFSWELINGFYIGRFFEQNSGLKTPSEVWQIEVDEWFVSEEPPVGEMLFDLVDAQPVWFFAMNGDRDIIDEHVFTGLTLVDTSPVCGQ